MSIKVMSQVWGDTTIEDQGELLVMLALADFSDDQGSSWPSVITLAEKSRMSERAVQYIIRKLEKNQRITVSKGGSGPKTPNRYRILRVQSVHPKDEIRVQNEAIRVQSTTEKGCKAFAPDPSIDPSIDPSPQLPPVLRTPRMLEKWKQWMEYRKRRAKCKNFLLMFREQSEFLGRFSEDEAHEVLSQSIRNGWQGLFEPKQSTMNAITNGHPKSLMDKQIDATHNYVQRLIGEGM